MSSKAKKQKKAKKSPPKSKPSKPRPRAQRLPGMEDLGIQELETLAQDIADVIAEKKEKMASEKVLNESLVKAMKKHGKTTYSHAGVHIDLSNKETAKVSISDDEDDTPADNEPAPAPKVNAESLAVNAEA